MPDGEGISFRTNYRINPYSGETCIRIGYNADDSEFIGINWLPVELPLSGQGINVCELLNISDDDQVILTFYMRGDEGDERIKCIVGGNTQYDDSIEFPIGTRPNIIRLDTTWERYAINLSSQDLSNVVTVFAVFITGDHNFGQNYVHVNIDDIVINRIREL